MAIEDYALIGDGQTAAPVHRDGSIDWLCWPRFDSPACFAALLGSAEHGQWTIAPVDAGAVGTRRYQTDTLVLESEYATASGRAQVLDFMPYPDDASAAVRALVRVVIGLEGTVAMRHRLALRFDHGRVEPWVESTHDGFDAVVGPGCVTLRSGVATTGDPSGSHADFEIGPGQRLAFVLSHQDANEARPAPVVDPEAALGETVGHWRRWVARFDRVTAWPDAVRRSLLTLHALIDRRSGGLVAAPTTSLPEIPGGSANWDYRFCWLRDASFTVAALLNAGLEEEAIAWRGWFLRAVGAEPAKLRIAYRVDGATDLDERELGWLPGHQGAQPVRVGNAAWNQHQSDVCGELIDALNLIRKAGIASTPHAAHVEAELVAELERAWDTPGQGLWESRGSPKHYVYSRVMAWVGVDCYLRGRHDPAIGPTTRRRLEALRTKIHADFCEHGYHAKRRTFVQHYGSTKLDASLLLLPLVGFLPADDPRIERTIDAIESELMVGGFVMRKPGKPDKPPEGAFLACTCWFADCRSLQGRRDEAHTAFERVLSVANDLGLLSEEYDTRGRRLAGNFPQALTHLAVVNTALGLSGPVLQRGGG